MPTSSSFPFLLFFCLLGLAACSSDAEDQQPRQKAADRGAQATGLWSDPATWGGEVPGPRDAVVIEEGVTVTLDTDTAPLHSLMIDGTLVAHPERDISLTSDVIMVHGTFELGTSEAPFERTATITLTGEDWDKNYAPLGEKMGLKVLGVMPGGTLEMVGKSKTSWTKLTATAMPGATTVEVEDATGWEVGDTIGLTPSDVDPFEYDIVTVTGIDGNTVSFEPALAHYHWGEMQEIGGFELDERAEVANLTRNIKIQGDDKREKFIGGHTMFMANTDIYIDSVEFEALGQRGVLARYPIHFHLTGDMTGAVVKNTSIHHSFQRCLTVHAAENIRIENNVAFDTFGHCYFLEDGLEKGNEFIGNLGFGVRVLPEEDQVEEDKHDNRSSVFWISNLNNRFVGNVAAGTEKGFGFWFDVIKRATHDETEEEYTTTDDLLIEFRDNVAHSTGSGGRNNMAYGPQQAGSGLTIEKFPVDGRNGSAIIENFTAYKNRNVGIWTEGSQIAVNARLSGNRVGFANFHFAQTTRLENSLVVAESANTKPGAGPLAERLNSGTFDGPWGTFVNKGDAEFLNVTFANFNHPERAVLNHAGDFSSYKGFAENTTFIDSTPYRFYMKKPEGHFAFSDVDGSFFGTGSPATVMAGDATSFARFDEDCSPYAGYEDVNLCSYGVIRFDLDANSVNGVEVTRPDGLKKTGGDDDDMGITARAGAPYSIGTVDGTFVIDTSGGAIEPLIASIRINGDQLQVFDNVEADRDVERSRGTPFQTMVESAATLDGMNETAVFWDPTTKTVHVRIFAGDELLFCVDGACRDPL